jgi:hypothetical protein
VEVDGGESVREKNRVPTKSRLTGFPHISGGGEERSPTSLAVMVTQDSGAVSTTQRWYRPNRSLPTILKG